MPDEHPHAFHANAIINMISKDRWQKKQEFDQKSCVF